MELLEEEPDARAPSPPPESSLREIQLAQAEARIVAVTKQQQAAAIYIQTLLVALGARSLLLLGLVASTGLTWLILTNPTASLEKMILVAATNALLVLPLVWLIARKV
jgi:hypothetical protein